MGLSIKYSSALYKYCSNVLRCTVIVIYFAFLWLQLDQALSRPPPASTVKTALLQWIGVKMDKIPEEKWEDFEDDVQALMRKYTRTPKPSTAPPPARVQHQPLHHSQYTSYQPPSASATRPWSHQSQPQQQQHQWAQPQQPQHWQSGWSSSSQWPQHQQQQQSQQMEDPMNPPRSQSTPAMSRSSQEVIVYVYDA